MPGTHNFEHLPLVLTLTGEAKLRGFGKPSPQTVANRRTSQLHSANLRNSAEMASSHWREQQARRQLESLPVISHGMPLLLKIDPQLDLDILREKFNFEIVSEQEDGYVIVATEDIDTTALLQMVDGFSVQVHGSANIASVHRLFDDPTQRDRLSRILSERILSEWNQIDDHQSHIVDVGIGCAGTHEIPAKLSRRKRETDAQWAARELEWSQARSNAYNEWDDIKIQRESEIQEFLDFYHAEIMSITDQGNFDSGVLPDSFTIRIRVSGKGLKDFVLNYPYIFEVVEPEDISLPQIDEPAMTAALEAVTPEAPDEGAPTVCIIDSGIQEGHRLIEPAVDSGNSRSFLPNRLPTDVADEVAPAGHGTRVAGAVLFGEDVPTADSPKLPFWIQNARVLDENNGMPLELFPPAAIRHAIEHFNDGPRQTRIFNHSINARGTARTRYMSAWAAEIDQICCERDVLVIQSAGNIPMSGNAPLIGIAEHLAAGREYPQYLNEPSARIANPGQSLQALTVGSVSYGLETNGGWRTFSSQQGQPSAFTRCGPGIWEAIKPEVVEYGGDAAHTQNEPKDIHPGGVVPAACPELVRSTLHAPGPAHDRDQTGTSYAAPKVARIAAKLQAVLPDEPTLLYRALIVQSARWPEWADQILNSLRQPQAAGTNGQRQPLLDQASSIMCQIGYGIPDTSRATENTDYRTTLITSGDRSIHAGECHIFEVPIPASLRRQADEFSIRIDITLSYVAQPRRTRRNRRRYLSTWVDWKSSNLGEGIENFRMRAMLEMETGQASPPGSTLPWTLNDKPTTGLIRNFKRNSGTVQKDWTVVRSNTLPDHFCIAVVGHQGWSRDPDNAARYALAVTFEVLGQEITIYEPLRAAVQELETQVQGVEIESEIEVEQ